MKIKAEKLCYYRKKSGLSQEEFGKKLGVSKQMVSHWENGRNDIPPKYHDKTCKILNISPDAIFTESKSEFNLTFTKEEMKRIKDGKFTRENFLDKLQRDGFDEHVNLTAERTVKEFLKQAHEAYKHLPKDEYNKAIQEVLSAIDKEHQKIHNEEDRAIMEYFQEDKNKLARYKLLTEIEQEKNNPNCK